MWGGKEENGDWAVGSRRRCPCLTRRPQQLPFVSVSIPASVEAVLTAASGSSGADKLQPVIDASLVLA
jgi:hypothetical protein